MSYFSPKFLYTCFNPRIMKGEFNQGERAVSPVIGVILMVAITVILAAVIGAFVLEIGDQQETAPNTSFDSQERVKIYKGIGPGKAACNANGCETNLTEISLTHVGGDVIDINNMEIKVDGNGSVYGSPLGVDEYDNSCLCADADPTIVPQPNQFKARGSNTPVTLSSGKSLEVLGFGGKQPQHIARSSFIDGRRIRWGIRDNGNHYCKESDTGTFQSGRSVSHTGEPYNPTIVLNKFGPSGACADDLDQGNTISITWRSDSGGKTQTLFRYTVKQSNANQ
jgi:flagellin-like protein